ncbi:Sushi, von Willebrand factor type A, EGF and pentraxin domain-containing protein 1, partial [Armadillidium vulgare]
SPEYRCAAGAKYVCVNCFNFANCVDNGDGTFSLGSTLVQCPSEPNQAYCDDSIFTDASNYGQCSPLAESSTDCSCSSSTQCIADPNNPKTILHCEITPPTVDSPCLSPALDLTDCSCLKCTDENCLLVDDPNDNCTKYYYCDDDYLISGECSSPLCFDQTECQCLQP